MTVRLVNTFRAYSSSSHPQRSCTVSLDIARSVEHPAATFPTVRPRRLRRTAGFRRLVRETSLSCSDVIHPMFVRPGHDQQNPILSMPGQSQWSIDRLLGEIDEIGNLGIPAVMLFGIPEHKDAVGSENWSADGIMPRAIRAIKESRPEMIVISDMCLCEYTDHGHCGVINYPDSSCFDPQLPHGYLLNDPTLKLLQTSAVAHAEAGADVIAPSGMIDGMVGAIRSALDQDGYEHVTIMSYAAKYASGFYGPFRDAAESPPRFGDRR